MLRRMENQDEIPGKSYESDKEYLLKLYISGSGPRSIRAINHITALCKKHLVNYDLQIIDIYENPSIAIEAQIIAVPTLIRVWPLPERRIIGNMADVEKVLEGLEG
jgi:circadian clock protein KaiB